MKWSQIIGNNVAYLYTLYKFKTNETIKGSLLNLDANLWTWTATGAVLSPHTAGREVIFQGLMSVEVLCNNL